MSFATPLAFALAALAIPIVIFYILKVRLRRVPVSTNLFWKQIYEERPPRSIWQYLRHLLSLLAQLLLVALLVLALADPYLPWQLLQARRIVAVIDNSASMRATDVKPSRFGAAVEAALATAEALRVGDEMAIVLAGPEPEVVVGMGGHVPTLKRALRSIKLSDNPTNLAGAIELGQQLIGDHPHGQVLVFTDGCSEESGIRGAWDRATPNGTSSTASDGLSPPGASALPLTSAPNGTSSTASDGPSPPGASALPLTSAPNGTSPTASDSPLILHPSSFIPHPSSPHFRIFGTAEAGNIGITQFQVRRSLIDPLGYEVLVVVRNASWHAVKGRLELELDGVPVDVLPWNLEPGGVFRRSLEKTSLEGGTLVAKLTEIRLVEEGEKAEKSESGETANDTGPGPQLNALSTDDQAWAVLPSRGIQNVLIVTPGNLFLQKVFEANPLVRIGVQKEFPETWPAEGIIVLHRRVPEKLPGGNVFVVDPLNGCDAWELGEPMENPIITEQDKDSPLMTHVRLDNVVMPEAKQLRFREPPRVLAAALRGDPVYAEVRRAGGKCLVLSVNINEGDLAFRTAFPIMVTNALGWFAGQAGQLRQALATGSTAEIDLEGAEVGSAGAFLLRSPTGDSRRLQVRGKEPAGRNAPRAEPTVAASPEIPRLSIASLSQCGVWSIVREGSAESAEPVAQLAVNLASDSETDLRTPAELVEHDPNVLAAGWFTRPIWLYLVFAACLLAVTEWWLYQRRVIT